MMLKACILDVSSSPDSIPIGQACHLVIHEQPAHRLRGSFEIRKCI